MRDVWYGLQSQWHRIEKMTPNKMKYPNRSSVAIIASPKKYIRINQSHWPPPSAIDPPLFQDSELSSDSVSGSWRFVRNFENLSKNTQFSDTKTHASKGKFTCYQLKFEYFCCFLAPAAQNSKNTEFLNAKTRRSQGKSIFDRLKFGYFCCFLAPAARKKLCKIRRYA